MSFSSTLPSQDALPARFKSWVWDLRDRICQAFETWEDQGGYLQDLSAGRFQRRSWERPGGGGGEVSLMKGRVFEKVGVNVSEVCGELDEEFQAHILGASQNPQFWACGLSLVAHMHSPLVPAIHMNVRHIVTSQPWFGGGMDLTPCFPVEQDTVFFHQKLQEACDRHDPEFYPRFKKACDQYFFLPHRQEPRGVGGLFFDHLHTGDPEVTLAFVRDVGETFLPAYGPLVQAHMNEPWTPEQRAALLRKRGRYVEFNLLYDRGTLFGLKTQGDIEAILMSLPPEVRWD